MILKGIIPDCSQGEHQVPICALCNDNNNLVCDELGRDSKKEMATLPHSHSQIYEASFKSLRLYKL